MFERVCVYLRGCMCQGMCACEGMCVRVRDGTVTGYLIYYIFIHATDAHGCHVQQYMHEYTLTTTNTRTTTTPNKTHTL